MEYFFTYTLFVDDTIVRIGKGHCYLKSDNGVLGYLRKRYGNFDWTSYLYTWRASEAAALNQENLLINEYLLEYGELPVWNRRRGGGGRQIYQKCKAYTLSGGSCRNNAIVGNYNFCGIHR